jgi:hypothetical protein
MRTSLTSLDAFALPIKLIGANEVRHEVNMWKQHDNDIVIIGIFPYFFESCWEKVVPSRLKCEKSVKLTKFDLAISDL